MNRLLLEEKVRMLQLIGENKQAKELQQKIAQQYDLPTSDRLKDKKAKALQSKIAKDFNLYDDRNLDTKVAEGEFNTNESQNIDDVQQLYHQYGKMYPYATDAVAYYIFGSKNDDNVLQKAFRGVYGRNTEVDEHEVSSYMLNYEYSWEENMEDINSFIENLPTKDGGKLKDYY